MAWSYASPSLNEETLYHTLSLILVAKKLLRYSQLANEFRNKIWENMSYPQVIVSEAVFQGAKFSCSLSHVIFLAQTCNVCQKGIL